MHKGPAAAISITINGGFDAMMRLGIIFGGRSGEHEVSLQSAYNILKAVDRSKYEVLLVGITHDGLWKVCDGPEEGMLDGSWEARESSLQGPDAFRAVSGLDVVFPALHGTFGEDGTLQGLLEMLSVPYVGCGVLASSLAMDKDATKRVLSHAGIKIIDYAIITRSEVLRDMNAAVDRVAARFDFPVFVKPANLGSSVGVGKAHDRTELEGALLDAAQYDLKIIVEECIVGKELEVAVLGNESPEASGVGEVVPCNEFYDYAAKYERGDDSLILIPADIAAQQEERIREIAANAFAAIGASGLARIDFFLSEPGGEIYLNEINTMPGFTNISMYPKLWEKRGVSNGQLVERLISLALERSRTRAELKFKKG
jgi:D-alanine-D-alanine ligase